MVYIFIYEQKDDENAILLLLFLAGEDLEDSKK